MSNDFCAVFGGDDPSGSLRSMGLHAAFANAHIAAGGCELGRSRDGFVMCGGEFYAGNMRQTLWNALAQTPRSDADLFAECVAAFGLPATALRWSGGMFSGAVWRTDTLAAHILRDTPGARTLYVTRNRGQWWVASRLRMLRRSPAVSDSLNVNALRDYLTYAFVPGEQTMWRDARELRPGTIEAWPDNTTSTYWTPAKTCTVQGFGEGRTLPEQAQTLEKLLIDVVDERLPGGQEVSVLLSGGLDSSFVTAIAAQRHSARVHTLSVHFGDEYRNELAFSSMVAKHCNTEHHIVELPADLIQRQLPETLLALDDPIGDPLTVPNLILAREASKYSRVILNGEGGDPCFGGPKNIPMILHEVYGSEEDFPYERAYLRSFQKCYDDLPRLLSAGAHEALRDFPAQEAYLTPFFEEARLASLLDRLMWLNVACKGSDHILTKVNNLTTAAGMLGLSPLFDRRVVEACFGIAPEHKLSGTQEKVALKAAAESWLPREIVHRPKSGMLVPVQYWFRKSLKKYAEQMLLDRKAMTRPYLNADLIRRWLDYKDNVWPRHGVKLWLLLTLEVWLRMQK